MSGSCADFGETYTGSVDWEDYIFDCAIIPQLGEYHNINFRVQGAVRSYAAGLAPNGRLVLYKNSNGYRALAQTDLTWEPGGEYRLRVKVCKNSIRVTCGDVSIEYNDSDRPYLKGAVGMSVQSGSHCHYKGFRLSNIN